MSGKQFVRYLIREYIKNHNPDRPWASK
jgi:hypothetical protein